MQDWNEVEAYVSSRYNVTHRSDYMVFFDLPGGHSAMIQEAEAAGLDYETLRVDAMYDDDEKSAYKLMSTVYGASNGLFTAEEVAGRLFVRHMIPTLILTGPAIDGFLGALAQVATVVIEKQKAGELRPEPD